MTSERNRERLAEAARLVEQVRPVLYGSLPEAQGVALAELTSIWLAGFHHPDATQTYDVRRALLSNHIKLVNQLLTIAETNSHEAEIEIRINMPDADNDDEAEPDDDGQPTELEEWKDYDPEC